jgi:HD-like signal output (HDOD) protein
MTSHIYPVKGTEKIPMKGCSEEASHIMANAQRFLEKFNSIKTLPHVAMQLSKLIVDESSSLQEFREVIKLDPTLVVRLLRLVNSPYYGLQQKVESIERAMIFLGVKNLRNLVIMEALKDIFRERPTDEIFSRSMLWLHCAAVSICSQMVSERIFEQKGEDAFLCGILHDIGMIVEAQVAQEPFLYICRTFQPEAASIAEYEQEILGTDHSEIGSLLAKDWRLPHEVVQGIRCHHTRLVDVSPSEIPGILQISEYMVSNMDYKALPRLKGFISPCLGAHIRDNLSEYKALARDLPQEISKARDLYEAKGE